MPNALDRVKVTPWVRRAAAALGAVIAIAFAAYHYARLTAAQQPRTFYDTGTYYQIAERPLSPQLFVLAKPPTVPLVFRAADRDAATIESVQRPLCFAAWLLLAASVVLVLRRPGARIAAGVVMLGMALAPARVGFTAVALSESLDDALLAVVVALALGLAAATGLAEPRRARVRLALVLALVPAAIAWIFARDTNALAAIAAVVAAVALWWSALRVGRGRWALGAIVLVLLAAVGDLTAARVAPDEALGFQSGWAPELTSRTAFPAVNNLLLRVMPDADARAFFADHGLPLAEVEPFAHPARNDDFVHADPSRAAAQAWIAEHGTATYASWLAHHPLDRLGELASARGILVAPDVHRYMPPGWIGSDSDHLALQLLRKLTANRWILLALWLAAPFALRPRWLREDPRATVALALLAGGLVAAVASFYGDALEPDRHCFGAAQQLALGLVIALACALDRFLAARAARATGPAAASR